MNSQKMKTSRHQSSSWKQAGEDPGLSRDVDKVGRLQSSQGGKTFAVIADAQVFILSMGHIIAKVSGGSHPFNTISISRDGSTIAAGALGGEMHLSQTEGKDWKSNPVGNIGHYWADISIGAGGKKVFAVTRHGEVWLCEGGLQSPARNKWVRLINRTIDRVDLDYKWSALATSGSGTHVYMSVQWAVIFGTPKREAWTGQKIRVFNSMPWRETRLG